MEGIINKYHQVVFNESGKFYILEDKIQSYELAEKLLNDFMTVIPYIDGDYNNARIYTIHENEEFIK